MSLIAVLVSITITGAGVALISHYKSNATDAMAELQTSVITESTVDFFLAMLSKPSLRPQYDVSPSEPIRFFKFSPTDLGLAPQTAQNVRSIRAIIRYISPTKPTPPMTLDSTFFPIAYDSRIDPEYHAMFSVNYWRTLTVIVEYGTMNGARPYQKGLKVTLKPTVKVATGGNPADKSFFNSSIYGKNSVSLTAGATVNAGDVSAGNNLTLGASGGNPVFVDGNVQLVNSAANLVAFNSVVQKQVMFSGSSLTISGNPPKTYSSNANNTNSELQVIKQGLDPASLDIINTPVTTVGDIPALAAPDSTTGYSADLANPQGNYVVDTSQLNSLSLPYLNHPVHLYVESSSISTDPIAIPNNLNSGGLAENLQISYNGQQPLNFTGSNLSAIIYAPNSKVSIGSSIKKTSLTGAIVGNDAEVLGSSTVTYDSNVAKPSSPAGYSTDDFNFSTTGDGSLRWQVHTVKELNLAEFQSESSAYQGP